ncbi:MAG: recombinase family protein [Rhodospirillales bacterium]
MQLAAIYARHSSDKQGTSTQDQIARCKKHCADCGYTIASVFMDEAISGAHILNRPGLGKLVTDALGMQFDVVVTEDLSRLSRDQGDIAAFYNRMGFLGIRIETLSDGVVNELQIGLKGTMNALYLKDLGDKTLRGQIAAVMRGRVMGGKVLGYDVLKGVLDKRGEPMRGLRKINEAEAEWVRFMFASALEGRSLSAICNDLDAAGVPTRRGGKWNISSLLGVRARGTGILRQTMYKGIITFNKQKFRKHPDTGKRLPVVNPPEEWIRVPVPELAIVDVEVFEEVQRRLDAEYDKRLEHRNRPDEERHAEKIRQQRAWRARQAKPQKGIRMFSGRMWCGRHYGQRIVQSQGKTYRCRMKGCPNSYIKLDEFWPLIVDGLIAAVSPESVTEYFGSEGIAAEKELHRNAIRRFKRRYDTLKRESNAVLAAVGRGLYPEMQDVPVKEYVAEHAKKMRAVVFEREKVESVLKSLNPPKNVETRIRRFRELVESVRENPDNDEVNRLLRPAFRKFEMIALFDDDTDTWQRRCDVDVDVAMLMNLLGDTPK